jgi:hypothetical protein
MDIEESGGIRCCLLTGINQLYDFLLLMFFELGGVRRNPRKFRHSINPATNGISADDLLNDEHVRKPTLFVFPLNLPWRHGFSYIFEQVKEIIFTPGSILSENTCFP